MPALLEYDFFRNALLGLVAISVVAGLVGTYIVVKRLVSIAGGITHACFGGLGLGWWLGVNPIAMAAAFAAVASVGVEMMSRSRRIRDDSAIAVIWAVGMALGVVFMFLTPGYVPELNAFLFGNILTVNATDLAVFGAFAVVVTAWLVWRRKLVIACAFDSDFAVVNHLPARRINMAMTLVVAMSVVLTIKLVGIMLLMAMMTLPQLIAETWCRRVEVMALWAVVVAVACSLVGLMLSVVIDVPCSALIVMVQGVVFALARLLRPLFRRKIAVG